MALPSTVGSGISWSAWRNTNNPPHEVGSAIYQVGIDKTANTIEMWKSTDGGDTWTEMNSAGKPSSSSTGAAKSVASCKDDTTIACAFWRSPTAPGSQAQFATFDTTTDTWSSIDGGDTTIPVVDGTGQVPTAIVARGSGDYVLVHNGPTDSVMGSAYRRIKVWTRTSGTWTDRGYVETSVQQHLDLAGIALGSSSRVHIFYLDKTANKLRHRSFLSGNTFGTPADIDTSIAAVNYPAGVPQSYVDGANTKVVIPYADSTGDLNVARFTSADSPSFTTEVVTTTSDPETTASNCGAVAMQGTTVHVFWGDASTDDLWRDSDGGTGTWGADVEHRDAITVGGVNLSKLSNSLGICYDDAGTVKYDNLSFGAQTIQRTLSVAQVGSVGVVRDITGTRAAATVVQIAAVKRVEAVALPVAQSVIAAADKVRAYMVNLSATEVAAVSLRRDVLARRPVAQASVLANVKRTYLDNVAAIAASVATARRSTSRTPNATAPQVPSVTKRDNKPLVATEPEAAALTRQDNSARQTAQASLGSLTRQDNSTRSVAQASGGVLGKLLGRSLPVAQAEVATAVSNRAYLRSFTALAASSATVAAIKSLFRALTGSAPSSATITRKSERSTTVSAPSSATLRRALTRIASVVASSVATVRRALTTSRNVTQSSSVNATKQTNRSTTATATQSAAVARRADRAIAALEATAASRSLRSERSLNALSTVVPSLASIRAFLKALTAQAPSGASILRMLSTARSAAQSSLGTVRQDQEIRRTAQTAESGSIRRVVARSTEAAVPIVAAVASTKAYLRALIASAPTVATVIRSLATAGSAASSVSASIQRQPRMVRTAVQTSTAFLARQLALLKVLAVATVQAASVRLQASRSTTAVEPEAGTVFRYTQQVTKADAPTQPSLRRSITRSFVAVIGSIASLFQGGVVADLIFPLKVRVMEFVASVRALEPGALAVKVREAVQTVKVSEPDTASMVQEPSTTVSADESGSMIVEVNEEGSDS